MPELVLQRATRRATSRISLKTLAEMSGEVTIRSHRLAGLLPAVLGKRFGKWSRLHRIPVDSAKGLEAGRVVVSIGRLGSSPATADYYLERQAGCETDYYTCSTQRRGRWLGDGAHALGLTGELSPAGEDALRALLDGRHPDGEKLLSPMLRLHPKARLPAAPLLDAIQQVARGQLLDVKGVLGDPRMTAAYQGLVRRSARDGRGEAVTVSADRARQLSVAAGLDPHTVYREADGADRYAEAVKHAGQRIDVRRAGVDTTVSAPKSVSVLFGLAGPHVAEQVRAAHAAAVEQAWSYLQAQAGEALRGHHGDGQSAARIGTDGPIVAAFDHTTSRAGDPQLHTHLVIPNLVHGADGRWSAMDTRALYRHAATASEIYHATLRGQLTHRLGVAWTSPARGRPEIDGLPRSLLRLFSTRRRQIEAELDRVGRTDPAAAQRACLVTRPVKAHVGEQSLRDRWADQTRAAGHEPRHLIASILGRQRPPALPDVAALETELLGPGGVTRHATTFDRGDLLQALCQTIPAGLPVDHQHLERLADRVLTARDTVPLLTRDEDGQRRYSTAELLSAERRALVLADHLGRQPGVPMDPAVVAAISKSRLSAEQSALIQNLADSGRLALIVGPAGTGKTTALAAAHAGWQAAGVHVQGTALAAVTARRLADATGIPSCSLARLLADADQADPAAGHPRGLHPAGVVVLDEASIVDTRRLARLFTHAARNGTALVLVGDPSQLPEIEAGGLFTQLAQSSRTLRLTDNRRQQDSWERDALSRLRAGDIDYAIDAYTAHGRIHHDTDPEELRAELVNDYLQTRANAEKPYNVAILAVTRADVAQLNALVRAALIAQCQLGATPLQLPTGLCGSDNACDDDPLDLRTGDLVIVGRNDNRLGLYNGTRGVVTAINSEADSLTLHTDDDRDVTVTAVWAASHDLRHAYAMTLHKAQGLTVDQALLYGGAALTREAGYVGLSRGRRENHVYATTREMSARNGECDFAKRDPLADEQQPVTDLARRLHNSRAHRLASQHQPDSWRSPRPHDEYSRTRSEGLSR